MNDKTTQFTMIVKIYQIKNNFFRTFERKI